MIAGRNKSIEQFDTFTMKPYTVSLAIGMRGSGKSVVMANIFYALAGRDRTDRYARLSYVYVFSGTEMITRFFSRWMDCPDFICERPDPNILQGIIDVQKRHFRDPGMSDEERDRIRRKHSICIILDDVTFDNSIFKNEQMRWLFMNGRHIGICLIVGMQFSMDMPSAIRGMVDYVFGMYEPVISNRKRLYEHYFGVFPTLKEFYNVFTLCTADYKCLVMDKSLKNPDPYACVFWYKGKPAETLEFQAGSEKFRRFVARRKRIRARVDGLHALRSGPTEPKRAREWESGLVDRPTDRRRTRPDDHPDHGSSRRRILRDDSDESDE